MRHGGSFSRGRSFQGYPRGLDGGGRGRVSSSVRYEALYRSFLERRGELTGMNVECVTKFKGRTPFSIFSLRFLPEQAETSNG